MAILNDFLYLVAAVPTAWLWSLSILIALLMPTLPLVIVRALNVKDSRLEAMEQRLDAAMPQDHGIVKVVLLTVPAWPSMEEVVHTDTSTGPTPVGFDFKADTIAGDINSALTSRGIEVRTTGITDIESIEDLGDANLAAVIFPSRHRQLPWQLLAFFDEVIEPRVSAYESPLQGIPLASLALGDLPEDVAAGRIHIERMKSRYKFVLLTNDGIVDTPDRLALYDQTLAFAEELLEPPAPDEPENKPDDR